MKPNDQFHSILFNYVWTFSASPSQCSPLTKIDLSKSNFPSLSFRIFFFSQIWVFISHMNINKNYIILCICIQVIFRLFVRYYDNMCVLYTCVFVYLFFLFSYCEMKQKNEIKSNQKHNTSYFMAIKSFFFYSYHHSVIYNDNQHPQMFIFFRLVSFIW